MAKVLNDAVGIERGLMTTIHAYTADQRLQDMPHKDKRRAQAAAINLIPTSTGAAKAIGLVLRTCRGSSTALPSAPPWRPGRSSTWSATSRETSAEEVNAAMKEAAAGPLDGILRYTEDPIVSTDIVTDPYSSVFDAEQTTVVDGKFVKVLSWYDNEWGYSKRCVELAERCCSRPP